MSLAEVEESSDDVEEVGKIEVSSRPVRSTKDSAKSPKRASVRNKINTQSTNILTEIRTVSFGFGHVHVQHGAC